MTARERLSAASRELRLATQQRDAAERVATTLRRVAHRTRDARDTFAAVAAAVNVDAAKARVDRARDVFACCMAGDTHYPDSVAR